MKKKPLFLFLILSTFLFSREISLLNPNDPQFEWMDELIEEEFSQIRSLSEKDLEIARSTYGGYIVCFKILNNEVLGRDCACKKTLEYLCENYGLPDLEFYYWNQDGVEATISQTCKVPVFTGARVKGVKNTVLFSDWYFDITDASRGWVQIVNTIDQISPIAWEMKIEKALFRGAGTDLWAGGLYSLESWPHHTRGKACYFSQLYPDLVDAAFTYFYPWDVYGDLERFKRAVPMRPQMSIPDQLGYKYQLLLCGKISTYPRDRWHFYSGCVVFWPEFPHESFWHKLARPWVEYVPLKRDVSDLIEKVVWAKNNDQECMKIARASKEFAEGHFMPEHIALYCYKTLKKYAALF